MDRHPAVISRCRTQHTAAVSRSWATRSTATVAALLQPNIVLQPRVLSGRDRTAESGASVVG